jgi:aldehyde dehydrogenase (NAD+)
LLIADIMNEAGVPEGVVNIVTGTGAEAGAPLAEHLDVDKIVFTGSTATGQSIIRASAGNVKRVSLELGGKSPVIVCADADLEKAVPVAAMSVFANSGQICIAGSRLFVERPIYDEFVERLAAYAKCLKVGAGVDSATEIGPLISPRQLERVVGYMNAGVDEGAKLLAGGARPGDDALAAGNFVLPTVFANVSDGMTIAREEIFGPVISALPFDTLDEAVERANNTPYGLAAGVFTTDVRKAHQLARRIRAGSVWVNTYHALDPAVPFGGYKMSGYGREGGVEHLEEYLNTKGIWIKID